MSEVLKKPFYYTSIQLYNKSGLGLLYFFNLVILEMVTSQKIASKALSGDYLIEACDLFCLEKVPKKIVDEIVNV